MSPPKSLIANVFFLTVLFPFISLVRTPFDVQPYALLAALLLICGAVYSSQMKLPVVLWLLGVPALYAIGLLWLQGLPNLAGLRAVSGYLSVFAIAAATYIWARHLKIELFAFAVYTWLAVALIQLFIYRDFGIWILPRFSPGYSYRGVASLATEPSHYAGLCFFFLLLNELFYSYRLYSKKQYLILAAILFLQILMSFSGLGLMLILIFISLKLCIMVVTRVSLKSLFRAFVTLLFVFTTTALALRNDYLRSTRAVSLVRIVLDNPNLLLRDESLRNRWTEVRLPLVGFYRSHGTGFGLASWTPNVVALTSDRNALVRFPRPSGGRIMSGWGTGLFELGVFGLGLIIVVSSVMIQGIHRDRSRRGLYLLILVSTHLALINPTPLAFPPFAFLIALCAVFLRKPRQLWPPAVPAVRRTRLQT